MAIVLGILIFGFFVTIGYFTAKAENELERVSIEARKTIDEICREQWR